MPKVASSRSKVSAAVGRFSVLFSLVAWVACAGQADTGGEAVGSARAPLCTQATLTASSTGPVTLGTPILLKASSAGCAAGESPEFRFLLRRDGASASFSEIRPYSPNPEYSLDTTSLAPGKYTAQVYSRAIGGTATRDASAALNLLVGPTCTAVTLSASPASPQLAGPSIDIAASATCSEGAAAEHRLQVRAPGASSYVSVGGWGSSPFQWQTAGLATGPYTLLVYTRAAGNASSYEASRSMSFSLGNTCSQLQGALSPADAAAPGAEVALTAAATCSNGSGADYQFSFRPNTSGAWTVIAPWGAGAATWQTLGLAAGKYQVLLSARANDYAGPSQVDKVLTYYLGGSCSAVTLTTSPKSPAALGTTLTLTGAATCVGTPVEYRFLYKDSLAAGYTEIAAWSTSTAASWPTQNVLPGPQTLMVEARVRGSAPAQQVSKTASYLLGDVCTSASLSASPISPQPAGTAVTLTSTAKCSFGGVPEYRFGYKPAGLAWVTFRDWGGPTANLAAAELPEGSYTARVEVRGQGHPGAAEASRSVSYAFGPACPAGYQSNGQNVCVDVNECASNNGGCHALTTCSNSPGGFACGPCPAGYSGTGESGCQDIDECATNNGGCHALTTCSNTQGGFECSPCPPGYVGSGSSCSDIDECATNHGGCDPLASCENQPGGFACGPCPAGYSGSGASGCQDVDECESNNGSCDLLTTCINAPGGRTCGACPPGFTGTGETGCDDIDECATSNGGCDALTQCQNNDGGFSCGPCPAGYSGSGATGCGDIDECASNHGGCDPIVSCNNAPGSFSCGPCPPGYGGSGQTGCIAPDPCSPNPCQNAGICSPNGASFSCTCSGGYGGSFCEIAPASLLAAGDIGDCNTTTDTATALLLGANSGTILPLGDLAYPNGSSTDFNNCFNPVWGPYKARMKPVPGNHEYNTAGAAPYYAYFGEAAGDPSKGYYSYDLGTWHVVALNSNCTQVSCSAGSAQEAWLRQDLAAHPTACTLAYWHHPRFSSGGEHGNDPALSPIWKALVDNGVEIALSGHDHDYERFAAQNDSAVATPAGVVQFVVGTGGSNLRAFGTIRSNSLSRNSSAHGVLKLTLGAGAYSWSFLPVAGKVFADSGTTTCH